MNRFQIDEKIATLEVIFEGYVVTVTVIRQDAGPIVEKDAEIALTKAMASFPQRISS